MNSKGEVLVSVWVYERTNENSGQILALKKGTVIVVQSITDNWVKHSSGYSMYKSADGKEEYIRLYDPNSEKDPSTQPSSNETKEITQDDLKESSDYVNSDNIDYSVYKTDLAASKEQAQAKSNNIKKSFLTKVDGIFGMPYQFMESVDPRLPGSDFGEIFTDLIVSRMPLLLLSPGRPMFMKDFSAEQRSDVASLMISKLDNSVDDLLDSTTGKYYSFSYNYKEYFQYLNPMLQAAAQFLGIGATNISGGFFTGELQHFKWQNYANSAFRNFVSSNESLGYYIDSPNQISESFSNQTGESALASKVNEASDLSREVQFLFGGLSGMDVSKLQSAAQGLQTDLDAWKSKYVGDGGAKNLLTNLLNTGLTTVVAGGKMIFPEIWKDSTYSNDYDVTIKLRTPDCDPLSWFFNICVPMMSLVCLVAPQSMGANAYKAPFLIKGFYKGLFNCQMGIITNMNISKGDKGAWTLGGLPTQVDINFTIKDLYNTLTLTKTTEGVASMDFIKNTYLVDWIANNCGLNVNKPDIIRRIELWKNMMQNNAYNKVTFDGFMGIEQGLTNLLNGFFKR